MNSTSGTTFTARDIIDILGACRDTGVAEFEGGGIRVILGRPAPEGPWDFSLPSIPPAPAPPPAPTQAEPDHEKLAEDGLAQEELRTKEAQIAELMVTDPMLAEEMIAKGDLVENEDSEETA